MAQLSPEEIHDYMTTAVKHLVDVAKTSIGLHLEMCDFGLEAARRLDLSEVDPNEIKEWEQILFSCEVVETLLGFKQKSHDYPEIVEMLQQHFMEAREAS